MHTFKIKLLMMTAACFKIDKSIKYWNNNKNYKQDKTNLMSLKKKNIKQNTYLKMPY